MGGNMKVFIFIVLMIPIFVSGQVVETTTEELTRTSDAIIVGTCVEKESFWNDKRDKIFTRIKIKADQYLKGDMGKETILTIPGGRVGDIIYEVSDMPLFNEGEEMVAFLWRHPNGMTVINGGLQGKKLISVDKKTGKKMIRENFKSHTPRQKNQAELKILLNDFIKEIHGFIKNKD
jgi:hypothetical protein